MKKPKIKTQPAGPVIAGPAKYKKLLKTLASEALEKLKKAKPDYGYGTGEYGLAEDLGETLIWTVSPEDYVPSAKCYVE